MSKGMKRFFIICAIAIGVGLIFSMIGYVTGGVADMGKISERYTWFRVGSVERAYEQLPEGQSFDSIKVNGGMDVVIDQNKTPGTSISYDKNFVDVDMRVENGVLLIDARENRDALINIAMEDASTYLHIYVEEVKPLEYIDIETYYGDIDIRNVTADFIKIKGELGDVSLDKISCIDMDIKAEYGDVDIYTTLPEAGYTVDCKTEMGEISIGNREYDNMEQHITQGAGKNMIKVVNDLGDVDIEFAQ